MSRSLWGWVIACVVVSAGGGALVLVEEERAHGAFLRLVGVVLIGAGGVIAAAIVAHQDKRHGP